MTDKPLATGQADVRNIVLLMDGTYNQIGLQGTNVLRLHECLKCDEGQLVFYDPGVGTLTDPNSLGKLRPLLRQAVDLATGFTMGENVIEAYRFLMRNYRPADKDTAYPGDRICLFGFSRGAYTAKAVAGMIHAFGLLRPEYENLVPYLWATYRAGKKDMFKVSEIYRTRFSYDSGFVGNGQVPSPRTVHVHFLGLWDTVSSYGLFWDFRTLPFTRHNPSAWTIRHAMALDERRTLFKVNHCKPVPRSSPTVQTSATPSNDVKEVWFAGFHSDVGGHPLDAPYLSDLAFLWMADEAIACHIRFDQAQLAKVNRSVPEEPQSSMHDSMDSFWKPVEFLPILGFDAQTRKRRLRRPNLFRRRRLIDGEVVHQSVDLWVKAGLYKKSDVPERYGVDGVCKTPQKGLHGPPKPFPNVWPLFCGTFGLVFLQFLLTAFYYVGTGQATLMDVAAGKLPKPPRLLFDVNMTLDLLFVLVAFPLLVDTILGTAPSKVLGRLRKPLYVFCFVAWITDFIEDVSLLVNAHRNDPSLTDFIAQIQMPKITLFTGAFWILLVSAIVIKKRVGK